MSWFLRSQLKPELNSTNRFDVQFTSTHGNCMEKSRKFDLSS